MEVHSRDLLTAIWAISRPILVYQVLLTSAINLRIEGSYEHIGIEELLQKSTKGKNIITIVRHE